MNVFAIALLLIVVSLSGLLAQSPSGLSDDNVERASAGAQASYADALSSIANRLAELRATYVGAQDESMRLQTLSEARKLLVEAIGTILPEYWYGTPWSFHGTTQAPGEGEIACGYFVTTLLDHIGLKIDRVRMAQQPSERIIKSLTSENHIRRFSNAPIDRFVASVYAWGAGLYLVGLDYHTGFVLVEDGQVFFIHSSYVQPMVVVRENALTSPILASSRYRVLGKLSDDDELLKSWLTSHLESAE